MVRRHVHVGTGDRRGERHRRREHLVNGNYVVASKHPRPWLKQLNLLAGYTYFFNPLRLVFRSFVEIRDPAGGSGNAAARDVAPYSASKGSGGSSIWSQGSWIDAGVQLFGMYGLMHTYRRTLGWAWQLLRGGIQRYDSPPAIGCPSQPRRRHPSPCPARHSHCGPGAAVGGPGRETAAAFDRVTALMPVPGNSLHPPDAVIKRIADKCASGPTQMPWGRAS